MKIIELVAFVFVMQEVKCSLDYEDKIEGEFKAVDYPEVSILDFTLLFRKMIQIHANNSFLVITGASIDDQVDLVNQYVQIYNQKNDSNILWINCSSFDDMVRDLGRLGSLLKNRYGLEPRNEMSMKIIIDTFHQFEAHKSLFIFVDAKKSNPVMDQLQYFVDNQKHKVILLSEEGAWNKQSFRMINVTKFLNFINSKNKLEQSGNQTNTSGKNELVVYKLKNIDREIPGWKDELYTLKFVPEDKFIVISGRSEYAKNQLVLKYIKKYSYKKDNIIWINSTTFESVINSLTEVGPRFGISIVDLTSIAQLFDHLKALERKTVIVFDDASSDNSLIEQLGYYLENSTNVQVIIISKANEVWGMDRFYTLNLDGILKAKVNNIIQSLVPRVAHGTHF